MSRAGKRKKKTPKFVIGRRSLDLIEIGRGGFSRAFIPVDGAKDIVYIVQDKDPNESDDAKRIMSEICERVRSGTIKKNKHLPKIEHFADGALDGVDSIMYRAKRYRTISSSEKKEDFYFLKALEDVRYKLFDDKDVENSPSTIRGSKLNKKFIHVISGLDWVPESVVQAFMTLSQYFLKLGGKEWCFDAFYASDERPRIANAGLDNLGNIVFFDPMFSIVRQDANNSSSSRSSRSRTTKEKKKKRRKFVGKST